MAVEWITGSDVEDGGGDEENEEIVIALIEDIVTDLLADGTYPGLVTGGTHHGMPTHDAARPYVEMNMTDSPPPELDTSDDRLETFPMLFKAFADTPTAAKTITDRIVTVLLAKMADEVGFPSEGTVYLVTKGGESLDPDPDKTTAGKIVWMSTVGIDFVIDRIG